MSCDVGALSVLLQKQLLVQTIHHEIVQPWPEQGELVRCALAYCPYVSILYVH